MAAWPSRSPRRASWSAALTLAGAALAAAAYAVAPPLVPPEQVVGVGQGEGIAVDQLGGQERVLVSTPSLPATELPPEQLSPRLSDPVMVQLHRSEPTADNVPGASTPAQSTAEVAAVIGGKDRCDPERQAGDRPSICWHPVETRAEEFARPSLEAPLQRAEKKLLGGRVTPTAEVIARDAAIGAAGSDSTVDDSSTQALASVVFGQPSGDAIRVEATPAAEKPDAPDPALVGILIPPGPTP